MTEANEPIPAFLEQGVWRAIDGGLPGRVIGTGDTAGAAIDNTLSSVDPRVFRVLHSSSVLHKL
jgi:hypothetical protein